MDPDPNIAKAGPAGAASQAGLCLVPLVSAAVLPSNRAAAPKPACPSGFTLIEMLVALAVALILVVVVASVTSSTLSMNSLIHGRLLAQQDAKVALDFLERDLDALAPAEKSRTTLSIVQERVDGPGGANEISSFWIMLLSRPVGSSNQGQIRTVSYRLLFTDPMVPDGAHKRLALYRTELPNAQSGNVTAFLDVADLHTNFWENYWTTLAADNGGKTLLDGYLVENVVDIKVTLNYLTAAGTPESMTLPPDAEVNWTSNGFEDDEDASLATPNTPVSITLTLTSLRPVGAKLYESGAMTLATAIQQQGVVLSRTFPIYPSQIN